MTFHLRNATAADIPSITEIYRDSVLHGTASYEIDPPDGQEMELRMTAIIDKGYPYLVACDGEERVLGYAYASAFRTRPAYRWLVEDSIYLSPDARGRGIGKALLAALIEHCTALGFRQMAAVIGGASSASCALHAGLGFRMVGRMEGTGFKHGQWLDTVFMQRELGEGTSTLPAQPSSA